MAAKKPRPYRPPLPKTATNTPPKNPLFHPWYRAATYITLMVIGVSMVGFSALNPAIRAWALDYAWLPLVAAVGLGFYWQNRDR